VDSSIESRCATQPTADIPANLLKRRAFCAARCREGHGCAQRNTLEPPGLDIDGMSNAKKENFLLKLCNQIA
jgi:hypothetical protein